MRRALVCVFCVLAAAAALLLFLKKTSAQSSFAERRITQAIDESKLTVLRGNTHPYARPAADQGAAPPDLAEDHMLLVLTPSAEQSAALATLLKQQQDPSSPNYHRWLSPDEFGQRFGVSEDDIATVSTWLGSHGFAVDQVPRGRTLIEFSGTAANVKEAFHTEIHKYFVNGEEHWANASDPQIPAALAPVVAGPASLHNFRRKPMNRRLGTFSMDKRTRQVKPLKPQFTFGTGCGLTGGDCFLVGPADFNKIYSVPSANTGAGINIGIVGDSRINPADAQDFDLIFSVTAPGGGARTPPTVSIASGGTDPGVQPNGDEGEADIDTQWSGAIAPGASINLVVSGDTPASAGVDLAAASIVNSQTNGKATFQILSESFGTCESSLGTAGNQMFGGADGSGGLWGQAAGEGITVLVSAGDSGSAGCENPNPNVTTEQPAISGLAVSGISTPYNVTAVGGTDFDQFENQGSFWNASNSVAPVAPHSKPTWPTGLFLALACISFFTFLVLGYRKKQRAWGAAFAVGVCGLFLTCAACGGGGGGGNEITITIPTGSVELSAKGPIPETTWNDSCSNLLYTTAGLGFDPTAEANCNDTHVSPSFIVPEGGGGGPSSCAITTVAGCAGYAKPAYQVGRTNGLDNFRDVPDLSFFAGTGLVNSFYPVCEQDLNPEAPPNPCNVDTEVGFNDIQGFGGTSVATQAFAGIVALLDQAKGGPQGAINTRLYLLASNAANVCTSSAAPGAGCIFNDIPAGKGTNAQPCVAGTPPAAPAQCPSAGQPNSILIGFNSLGGYDEATGLGSVNVQALINAF